MEFLYRLFSLNKPYLLSFACFDERMETYFTALSPAINIDFHKS